MVHRAAAHYAAHCAPTASTALTHLGCFQEFSKFTDEGAASRLKFTCEPFSLRTLVADLTSMVGMKAESKQVEVVVRKPP